jgi:hypothetical protein
MAIKVKEMKDDAIIDVRVNKTYYLMVKAVSFYLFTQIKVDDKEAYLKKIASDEYSDLDDLQKSFYTITLLLAEIEKMVNDQKLYDEKEVLQPGDEGYVAPTLD